MRFADRAKDAITLIILTGFLLACYATTHRGPRTLDPGQISASGSYLRFKAAESDPEDEPGQLIGVEGRVGIIRGLDVGVMRTFDISEGVESGEGIDTYWLDSKFQLTNRGNQLKKPILSFGYGFGKLVNEEDFWVNTLYLLLGTEAEKTSMYYSFRYETFDDKMNFIPRWAWEEPFDEIRKAHIVGLEYAMSLRFKPVVEIGRFYSGDFSSGSNVLTAGVNLYLK